MLTPSRKMIVQGIVAGFLGGIAGSAAKLAGEGVYPPRTMGQEPPPAVLAEKVAGHPLTAGQKTAATQTFHWTLGSGMGAAYGLAAEFVPQVTFGYGAAFGIAVLLGTHESILPLLGLNEPPTKQPFREQSSEVVTHTMYGVATELVRRALVRYWRRKSVATGGAHGA